MRGLFLLIFIIFSIVLFGQDEKRLALVIGNSNYEKGALKNPVNDAELVAKTLDSLNFDVILKTNLESRSEFIRAVREFGQKRAEYDVAFIYYAGHGIQVDNENFLLPTKEEFLSEDDVLDFGVSVQNVLRYLESESEKVNILILDACRDNPFELKWNATRSLKGSGLAKIPPPTGSLIAFSTDAGSTAADGASENSIYCKSLCKNFLLEDVSIDQVFRNIRSDVLKNTNNKQRPVESSQLTGQTFYLLKPSANLYIQKIDSMITNKMLNEGLLLSNIAIFLYPENSTLLTKRGHVNSLLENNLEAFKDYSSALKINPKQVDAYFTQINFENDLDDVGIIQHLNFVELGEELGVYDNWISLDKNNAVAYQERARYFNWELNEVELSIKDLDTALSIVNNDSNHKYSVNNYIFKNPEINFSHYLLSTIYINFSYVYQDCQKYENALKFANLSCNLNKSKKGPIAGWSYYSKASSLELLGRLDDAEKFYKKSIEKMPDQIQNFLSLAKIYNTKGKIESAIACYDNAHKISNQTGNKFWKNLSIFYKAILNYTNNNYYLALESLNRLEYLEENQNSRIHLVKFLIYKDLNVFDLAIRDLENYLIGCCFYHENKNLGDDWFKEIPLNKNFKIPDSDFYEWVYSKSQKNIAVPWKGNDDLNFEIKDFITKYYN